MQDVIAGRTHYLLHFFIAYVEAPSQKQLN